MCRIIFRSTYTYVLQRASTPAPRYVLSMISTNSIQTRILLPMYFRYKGLVDTGGLTPPTSYLVVTSYPKRQNSFSHLPNRTVRIFMHRILTDIFCSSWQPRKVEGAGSEEIDGVYRVSRSDEQHPPQTAYFVSGKTLAGSMTPQERTPTYTHDGGGNVISLSQDLEGRNTWYIR